MNDSMKNLVEVKGSSSFKAQEEKLTTKEEQEHDEAVKRINKIFGKSDADRDFFSVDFHSYIIDELHMTIEEVAQKSDEEINELIKDFAWAHRWDPFFG